MQGDQAMARSDDLADMALENEIEAGYQDMPYEEVTPEILDEMAEYYGEAMMDDHEEILAIEAEEAYFAELDNA